MANATGACNTSYGRMYITDGLMSYFINSIGRSQNIMILIRYFASMTSFETEIAVQQDKI